MTSSCKVATCLIQLKEKFHIHQLQRENIFAYSAWVPFALSFFSTSASSPLSPPKVLPDQACNTFSTTKFSKDPYLTLVFTTHYQNGRKIETTTSEVTIHLPIPAAVISSDPFSFLWPVWGQCFKPDQLNMGPYKLNNAAFKIIFLTVMVKKWLWLAAET